MKQQATIVRHNGRLMAEVVRSEACRSCGACNFGKQERVYIDTGALRCTEGDTVTVEIDEGSVSRASLAAYGIPAAALFAGLFIGAVISDTDYIQALCALAGLAAGLAVLSRLDKKLKRTGRFTPKVSLVSEEPRPEDIDTNA